MSNTAEDIKRLEEKAAAGDASAMNSLGCAYHQGDGVPKNYARAYELFLEASKKRNKYATSNIALMYRYGQHLPLDILKAFSWYVKAVNQGSGATASMLGEIFLNGGSGFPRNENLAFYWFKKGAEWSDDKARHNLSICHEKGIGCNKNLEAANRYCTLSLEDIKRGAGFFMEGGYFYLNKWIYTSPLVTDNPFRTLGVFSNCSNRELTLNLSKLNAYSKVGKSLRTTVDLLLLSLCPGLKGDEYLNISELSNEEFENIDASTISDLENTQDIDSKEKTYKRYLLTRLIPNRNEQAISNALSLLSDKNSKIKYSFFWFICASKEDEQLFELIISGKKEEAIKIWNDRNDYSALINVAVLNFLEESHYTTTFLENITKVIYTDNFRYEFLEAVCGDKSAFSKSELMKILSDALIQEMPNEDWSYNFRMNFIDDNDSSYVDEFYAKRELSNIENLITTIDNSCQNSSLSFDLILNFIWELYPHLLEVKDLLGSNDYRYEQMADRIAESILSVSQAYYRKSSTQIFEATDQCISLAEWALDIACGPSTKDLMGESLEEIKRIKNTLPSKRVFELIRDLGKKVNLWKSKVETVDNALSLIKECAPLLRTYKEIVGKTDEKYVSVSTDVAALALNMTIEQFNTQWQAFEKLVEKHKANSPIPGYALMIPEVKAALERLKKMLSLCCQLFSNIDILDIDSEFKQTRYKRNKDAIIKDAKEAGVVVSPAPTINLTTEQEFFQSCTSRQELERYLKLYPNAKFLAQANRKIEELKKIDDQYWSECSNQKNYARYLSSYPDGLHKTEANQEMDRIQKEKEQLLRTEDHQYWDACKLNKAYKAYLLKYPEGLHAQDAKDLLSQGVPWVEILKDIVYSILLIGCIISLIFFIFI